MTRRRVRLTRKTELAQSSLDLSLVPLVEGSLALDGAAALGAELIQAALPPPPLSSSSPSPTERRGLPPLTKAQVHYWRELCGVLTRAGTAGVPSAEEFPPALCPSHSTLKAMVAYGILARRHRAWHLTRPWYARLTTLRAAAVDTPQLRPCERPAPGLPSYAELQAWEAICRWLDTQSRQRARLPFLGLTAFTLHEDAAALPALGETPEGREVPAGLLRGMRTARIVRHTKPVSGCSRRRGASGS